MSNNKYVNSEIKENLIQMSNKRWLITYRFNDKITYDEFQRLHSLSLISRWKQLYFLGRMKTCPSILIGFIITITIIIDGCDIK